MSETYYKAPFSCSYNAGRWNPKGMGMICAGSGPAISLLEYLCIKGNAVSGKSWYMIEFGIQDPNLIGTLEKDSLPENWNVLAHAKVTQDFGRAWLQEKEFPFLKVPSARLNLSFYPLEHNLLINPDFPDFKNHIEVVDEVRFDYLMNSD
ncbi:RES family NAD+ phosphorylase [Aquiflexum sp. TKW24L]|uniref:RES family NAD+ phosphorylase n=1 Tax=Aquiflexum sp. TKW24L TaxID=2942212 RepID=UPI0020C12590|nr:RES family NAD+ phosphorylase [Aquiflexum sp. TKW24L]MCL6258108.1 RES family NAD+ phosphorylase [Aquiflexum sp. TKW24L]